MYKGNFDLDQTALNARIAANTNEFNLEDWIFSHLTVGPQILELGCGSGKQTKYMLEHFPDSMVTAIDKVPDSLGQLRTPHRPRLLKWYCDFDNLPFNTPWFDTVLSVYSFYYSRDMAALLEKLKQITKPGGIIFLVGPGRMNNVELMSEIKKDFPGRYNIDQDFIETEGEYIRTHNTIQFPNTEAVWQWWRQHNTFSQDIYDVIKDRVKITTLTKSILGVKIHV